MLVLSRKKNESVVINRDITVTIVDIHGDKVRLGFNHPRDVSIHRQEVFDEIYGPASAEPSSAWSSPESRAAAAPEPPPVAALPAQPADVPSAPASSSTTDRSASLLDRIVDALRARTQTPVSRDLLTQAIADASVHELWAEVVRSTPADQLKSLLLEALKARE